MISPAVATQTRADLSSIYSGSQNVFNIHQGTVSHDTFSRSINTTESDVIGQFRKHRLYTYPGPDNLSSVSSSQASQKKRTSRKRHSSREKSRALDTAEKNIQVGVPCIKEPESASIDRSVYSFYTKSRFRRNDEVLNDRKRQSLTVVTPTVDVAETAFIEDEHKLNDGTAGTREFIHQTDVVTCNIHENELYHFEPVSRTIEPVSSDDLYDYQQRALNRAVEIRQKRQLLQQTNERLAKIAQLRLSPLERAAPRVGADVDPLNYRPIRPAEIAQLRLSPLERAAPRVGAHVDPLNYRPIRSADVWTNIAGPTQSIVNVANNCTSNSVDDSHEKTSKICYNSLKPPSTNTSHALLSAVPRNKIVQNDFEYCAVDVGQDRIFGNHQLLRNCKSENSGNVKNDESYFLNGTKYLHRTSSFDPQSVYPVNCRDYNSSIPGANHIVLQRHGNDAIRDDGNTAPRGWLLQEARQSVASYRNWCGRRLVRPTTNSKYYGNLRHPSLQTHCSSTEKLLPRRSTHTSNTETQLFDEYNDASMLNNFQPNVLVSYHPINDVTTAYPAAPVSSDWNSLPTPSQILGLQPPLPSYQKKPLTRSNLSLPLQGKRPAHVTRSSPCTNRSSDENTIWFL